MIRKCVFFPTVTFSEFPIYGHSRESRRRRCHEINASGANATLEFQAMIRDRQIQSPYRTSFGVRHLVFRKSGLA